MAFTYTPEAPTDLTRVRWHSGQTVEAESFVSDAEIAFALAEEGSWRKAVISVIKFIIARLSQPNFKADWLQVDNATARAGFETLLAAKRAELGIPAITGSVQSVYRSDSNPNATVPDDLE